MTLTAVDDANPAAAVQLLELLLPLVLDAAQVVAQQQFDLALIVPNHDGSSLLMDLPEQ
eukprot:CAMPEP_0174852556 /NCGR_PEP_ID=MMETSP1114-20130205/25847_1 /TAXON_ID=312471 /ORGANISM="Neobodo designis, Strain CCAP 1951/1" /LENGTH=58 /DNA_ID=CAMNT_0016087163 /DNA_START=22 /DNA_END=199 /DNA_ORIENTATION=+